MRNDIVQNGNHLAASSHPACHITQRRGEPGHPVTDYQQVRFPVAYGPEGLAPGKRIGRIQQRNALYGYGLIVRADVLGLSREKHFRILPAEIERLDIVRAAQLVEQAGVELRNATPVGVETGQYRYLQSQFSFLLFLFLMYSSFRPARISSVMFRAGRALTIGLLAWLANII